MFPHKGSSFVVVVFSCLLILFAFTADSNVLHRNLESWISNVISLSNNTFSFCIYLVGNNKLPNNANKDTDGLLAIILAHRPISE